MSIRAFRVPVTTDGSGDATAYSDPVFGTVKHAAYIKTDFADGVDFTITGETTGQGIWTETNVNASTIRYPMAASHSTAGAAALYAGGGSAVNVPIVLAGERIKVVVASGGSVKTGVLVFAVEI